MKAPRVRKHRRALVEPKPSDCLPPSASRPGLVTLREATPEDNAGLLALTRATPMDGVIPLRIDRAPDFFRLLNLRGDGKVIVATHSGRPVGCISVASRPVFVSGKVERVGYVGDLKVHPSFTGSRVVLRLIRTLQDDLLNRDFDLLFTVTAAGNRKATSLLQGRLGTPRWWPMGEFRVYELLPSPVPWGSRRYEVGPAEPNDLHRLVTLINDFNRSFQFAPPVTEEQIRHDFLRSGEDPFARILVARSDGQIVASVSLFDTGGVKSNVLIDLPPLLKICFTVLRAVSGVVPLLHVPRIGEPIRLLYLRHPAHAQGHRKALRALFRRAQREAFRGRYAFLVFGVHERDPLRVIVRSMPKFTFVSQAFVMSLHDRPGMKDLAAGVPMEDFALV